MITLNASKLGFISAKEIILIVVSRWNSAGEGAEVIWWGRWDRARSQEGDGAAGSADQATNPKHQMTR